MEISEGERLYNTVKRSLDSLGYKGQLSLESAPLMNRVVSDLLKATKSFRNLKIDNDKLQAELRVQGDLILPLRNENIKLAKENNELHKLIIKVKDENDISNSSNESATKKLSTTNEELQFLLTQKNETIKNLETQIDSLRLKLNNIFNILYMGQGDKSRIFMKGLPKANKIISTENPNSINTTFKKPSFDISTRLDMSSELNAVNVGSSVPLQMFKEEIINISNGKQEWARDLKIAESNADKLRIRITSLENENDTLKDKLVAYEKGMKTRDLEIKRLQDEAYLGDNNKEEIKVKYNSEFISLQNQKLLMQIDFLNKENHRLEAIDYFHNHRCRQEEVNRLDEQINNLTKENEKLKKAVEKFGIDKTNLNTSQMRRQSRVSMSGIGGSSTLKTQVENLKKDKADLVQLLEEEREKVKTITKELMDTRDDFNSRSNTLKKEKDEIAEKYEKLKCEISGGIQKVPKNDSLEEDLLIKQDLNELKKLEGFGEDEEGRLNTSSNKRALLTEKLNEIDNLKEQVKNKELEINELKEQVKNKDQEIDELNLQLKLNNNYEQENQNLKKENSMIRKENSKYKVELERLTKESEIPIKEEKDNSLDLKKKDEEIANLKLELKKKETELELIKEQLEKQKNENENLVNEKAILQNENDKLKKEFLELTKDKNEMILNNSQSQSDLEKKNKSLQREIDTLKNQVKNMEDLNISKEQENEKKSLHDSNIENEVNKLKEKIKEYEDEIIKNKGEMEKLAKENKKLKKNLQLFANENSAAAQKIRELEKSLTSLEAINVSLINRLANYEPQNFQKVDRDSVD